MNDLINTVLYTKSPNIVTPSLQIPILSDKDERFAENLKAE